MKSIQELTKEELSSKKKKLLILLVVLSLLILLYAGYFVVKLINETWQANNTLGVVGLGVVVVFISNATIQLTAVQKEIKSRNDNKG